jgi:nitrate/nitrite transporter NarK
VSSTRWQPRPASPGLDQHRAACRFEAPHLASGMSWALASVAAPAHCTASLGSIQNFGGYLGGALAPTVTGFIVQATGTFVPALLVGAVIALASALAYLVVIPNRPIRSAELGVAAPSAPPSGSSM